MNSELMAIGTFARASGLTSSALRFYADSGLLQPAHVDPSSGYRRYSRAQIANAQALRQLRAIGMPLATVRTIMSSSSAAASQLIDCHVESVLEAAADAQRTAATVKSQLFGDDSSKITVMKGTVLAAAIDQVLTAADRDPSMPVLSGLRLEVTPEAMILTSTCRFLLSTRTVFQKKKSSIVWSATINGDDMRAAVPDIRHSPHVQIHATERGVRFLSSEREVAHCRVLADDFPDYKMMLRNLPTVTNRVTVAKDRLQTALEEHPDSRITLHLSLGDMFIRQPSGLTTPSIEIPVLATPTGPALDIEFEVSALYAAIATAIGAEITLDFRGPHHPVTVRSADRADLTTLTMPIRDTKYDLRKRNSSNS